MQMVIMAVVTRGAIRRMKSRVVAIASSGSRVPMPPGTIRQSHVSPDERKEENVASGLIDMETRGLMRARLGGLVGTGDSVSARQVNVVPSTMSGTSGKSRKLSKSMGPIASSA